MDIDDIRNQCQFCTELMLKLNAEIHESQEGTRSGNEDFFSQTGYKADSQRASDVE